MKSFTIDFTTDYYIGDNKNDGGFSGVGFGNIMCIIGLSLSYIKDQSIPIFVKIDENICEKTYYDTLNIIDNLKFGNFQISLLNDSIGELIEIDDILKVNDNSNNNYVIRKRNIKNCSGFFHAKTYGICKNLNISFKNPREIEEIIKMYNSKIFNIIKNDFIVINIRRGEKLLLDNYLKIDRSLCEKIIKSNNSCENILFISDDINWCKTNFYKFKNVYFYDSMVLPKKSIIDQYILHLAKYFFGNLDCTFSTVPLMLSTNKILKYYFFCKFEEFENESKNIYSRFNFLKGSNLCEKMFLVGC